MRHCIDAATILVFQLNFPSLYLASAPNLCRVIYTMHELSIACELVELVEKSARDAGAEGILTVHLRLSMLAGVEVDALRMGYLAAIEGTLLHGARLEIEETPVSGWCAQCGVERAPVDVQWLACPVCDIPLTKLQGGREIEVVSIELTVPETPEEDVHVHAFA